MMDWIGGELVVILDDKQSADLLHLYRSILVERLVIRAKRLYRAKLRGN